MQPGSGFSEDAFLLASNDNSVTRSAAVASERSRSRAELRLPDANLSIDELNDPVVQKALANIIYGLAELRGKLNLLRDPDLIAKYNAMSLTFVNRDNVDSDGDVFGKASFEGQSITFYRQAALLNTYSSFLLGHTMAHEFRHLHTDNYSLLKRNGLRETLSKEWKDRSWEQDAQKWATQLMRGEL
ncbi:hypothetical protein ACL7TT_07365 [Microbulbifer sp. 2304DJ12-6]|uniref:hypothetical protein n=1 Tax=Microbulbifer sp. 2304DJ12-6 TaxID=3233340 RepID=UPI0039B10736